MGIFRRKRNGEAEVRKERPAVRKKIVGSTDLKGFVSDLIAGSLLTRDAVQRQLPFFIFVVILALTYVNNSFLYEAELKRNDKAKKELLDVKYKSLTTSRQLMEMGRRSKVQERLKAQGSKLEETRTPVVVVRE